MTIDIGANDVLGPSGLGPALSNLPVILAALRAAAGEGVPIIGMTYYDVDAPICVSDPSLAFLCSAVDTLNATLADGYAAAGDPVADVAEACENDNLVTAAAHVCAWTWFCVLGDVHANTVGHGAIAQPFEQVIP